MASHPFFASNNTSRSMTDMLMMQEERRRYEERMKEEFYMQQMRQAQEYGMQKIHQLGIRDNEAMVQPIQKEVLPPPNRLKLLLL